MNNHLMPKYVIQYEVRNIDNFQTAAVFHFWDKALYLTTHPIRQGLLLLWMFYSEGDATFQ